MTPEEELQAANNVARCVHEVTHHVFPKFSFGEISTALLVLIELAEKSSPGVMASADAVHGDFKERYLICVRTGQAQRRQ